MKNRLISDAYKTYKIAPLSSWILGLTTGILVAAIVAIDLVVPGIVAISFPFIIIPILFSATLQHVIFKTKGQLTFGSSLKSFTLYYNPRFFGSFSILGSLLKGLIVFLAFEMTISFIASTIFQATSTTFIESLNALYETVYEYNFTYDDLVNIFNMNGGILFTYLCAVILPSLFLAILVIFYSTSRSSIMIYYKMSAKNVSNRFAKLVYSDVLHHKRMAMFKDYWTLNWPLYMLLILGFVGGAIGGFFWKGDLVFMLSLGLVSGAVLGTFFLPFYFGNQETLYDTYAPQFISSTGNITNYLLNTLQKDIDLSIEEKEKMKENLSNLNNPLEDEDQNDNKKDPDGSQ